MELIVKPEILTSYIHIYRPTFGNAEIRLFLFSAQCFNTESIQKGYPSYRLDLIRYVKVKHACCFPYLTSIAYITSEVSCKLVSGTVLWQCMYTIVHLRAINQSWKKNWLGYRQEGQGHIRVLGSSTTASDIWRSRNIQTDSGVHRASYSLSIGCSLQGTKRPGREADPSPQSFADDKNELNKHPHSPYTFTFL
jgi:hypothetical protein